MECDAGLENVCSRSTQLGIIDGKKINRSRPSDAEEL